MKIADDILEAKNCELWTVAPDDSVQNALIIMSQKNVGALLVMQDERLIGILSERDYVRKIVGQQLDPEQTRVREIMTSDVVTVSPTATIEECMQMMVRGQFRHLPVLLGEIVVGLISIHDIVRALMGGK